MENLVISSRKKVTLAPFCSDVKMSTEGNITKVLSVNAKSVFTSIETSGGFISLSGKITMQLVYLNDENKVLASEGTYDFIEKQKCDYLFTDIFGIDDTEVCASEFSGNEIICSLKHFALIYGKYSYDVPDTFDNEAELVKNKEKLTINKYISGATDDFAITEELTLNQSNVKILNMSSEVLVDEVSCMVDKVCVEGKTFTELVYSCDDEIYSLNKEFEFKQEVACSGVVPNNFASGRCTVKNVSVSQNESENKTILSLVFDILANICVYEEDNVEICSDLFSLNNELSVAYDYVELKNYLSATKFSDSVLSQTEISNISDFDDIVNVYNPVAKIISSENLKDKTILHVELTAVAIYKTSDSFSALNVKTETKYEINYEQNQETLSVLINPTISSFKVKAGKELEVAFKLDYIAEIGTSQKFRYVKTIENLKEKEQDCAGIRVYITRAGETLFDVAKILNVKPEIVQEQNELNDVFEQGQKIYVYSPINLV